MSIYPVRIDEWYDDPKSAFFSERDMLKTILEFSKCCECGAPMADKWDKGFVMHAITFGGPDGAWCSLQCLNGDSDE